MLIAEKIYKLRKEMDISQEELAEKLDVSRQSISKWESAMSIPDMNRIIQLSEFFGVSTDYLLKDELESSDTKQDVEKDRFRRVTLEEVNEAISKRKRYAKGMAVSIGLLINSCVPIIFFSQSSQEYLALGLFLLFALVAVGVGLIIVMNMRIKEYEYLEKSSYKCEYGVIEVVRKQHKEYSSIHAIYIAVGIVLIILSVVPVAIAGVLDWEERAVINLVVLMFILVSIGVGLLIYTSNVNKIMEVILKMGEYTDEQRRLKAKKEPYETLYWLIVTAIYLLWSFLTFKWYMTWIIWPIAGIFSYILFELFHKAD